MIAQISDPPRDDPDVVESRYVVRVGELRLVGCDSTIPGRDHGEVALDWLAATSAA